jgi:uncharacterized protein
MILKCVAALSLAASSVGLSSCRPDSQAPSSQVAARHALSGLETIPLTIRSGGREHRFTVEVARTPEEQAQGLMWRESLAPNEGMLFPFPSPRPASFWMMNTLIPLDMIFIRQDGIIVSIAVNTEPHSTIPVEEPQPVVAVLELPGGRSDELGIKQGDRVSWHGGPR